MTRNLRDYYNAVRDGRRIGPSALQDFGAKLAADKKKRDDAAAAKAAQKAAKAAQKAADDAEKARKKAEKDKAKNGGLGTIDSIFSDIANSLDDLRGQPFSVPAAAAAASAGGSPSGGGGSTPVGIIILISVLGLMTWLLFRR